MRLNRRELLESAAAASALGFIGQRTGWADSLAAAGGGTRWVKSVCRYCGTGCGLYIGVQGGRVTAVKGDEDNHNGGLLCLKGFLLPQIMDAPTRLTHSLVRKDGKLVRASWEEAMELVAGRFRRAIDAHGPDAVAFYGSGQGLTEETYVANKLFKAGIRTNNVEGNPRLCMASAVGGYVTTYGKDEPMGCYEDIDQADVFFLIGSNTAECHPILFHRIVRRKEADPTVKVIVADPRRTPTARIADLHLTFTPGTDLAILNAMAHVLVAEGMVDEGFIQAQLVFGEGKEAGAESWGEYKAFLADYTPQRAAEISGARAEDIVQAARWFGQKGRTAMSMWTMGLNQRTKGVWANNLVHNLHLITGKIGVPGSTPLSLTGQPNACGGVRDGGGLSHLLPYGRLVANAEHRQQMERLWKVPEGTLAAKPGLPTVDLFRAVEAGDVKCLYIMCTNPGQSMPNVDRYRAAMGGDAFVVVAESFHPTRTSELADVVLPAALWAEKEGVYGCTERRYQLLEQAVEPAGEARPDWEILADLGRRLGYGELLKFSSPADIWEEILAVCKGTPYDFNGATRERLRREHGLLWPIPTPDHPGTKRRYVRGEDPFVPADHPQRMHFYGRPDGKAVVWLRPHQEPAEAVDADYPVCYTTGRVIEHWHTGTMTGQVKELRHASYEAAAEISPADAKRWGVKTGDRLRLTSRRGELVLPAKVSEGAGENLVFVHMHDPERLCNRLTIDAVDPGSKQPEFKIAAVKVAKEG